MTCAVLNKVPDEASVSTAQTSDGAKGIIETSEQKPLARHVIIPLSDEEIANGPIEKLERPAPSNSNGAILLQEN